MLTRNTELTFLCQFFRFSVIFRDFLYQNRKSRQTATGACQHRSDRANPTKTFFRDFFYLSSLQINSNPKVNIGASNIRGKDGNVCNT